MNKTSRTSQDACAGPQALPWVEKAPKNEAALRMLEIAERLFAENGIGQVPLRQIVSEAGQRNSSALHYHFGSREALVSQLLNLRMGHVNQVRHRYLDRLEASGQSGHVRRLVEATISALADTLCDMPWGHHYISVLAQAAFSPALADAQIFDPQVVSATERVRELIAAARPDIPDAVLRLRYAMFCDNAIYALAKWSSHRKSPRDRPPVAELVDYCSAALVAGIGDPSPDVQAQAPR